MASFNLHLQFNNDSYSFLLNSGMSLNDIKRMVAEPLRMNTHTFDIQVYDEYLKDNCMFDDEYVDRLHEDLPRTSISDLYGDILLNSSSIGCCILDSDNMVAEINGSSLDSLSEWNMINNEDSIPIEVNRIYDQEDEFVTECLQIQPVTESKEEKPPLCQLEEIYCTIRSDKTMISTCDIDSTITSDEIGRTICQNDIYQPDKNELQITTNTNNHEDIVVRESISAGTNPVEPLYPIDDEQNSNAFSPFHPGQSVQQRPLVKQLSSLEFVHDVQPYQKIQYDTNNVDECLDEDCQPYVMRIQGIKTDADKGKSVVPELKILESYIRLHQQFRHQLFLMVAAVRELIIDDKRIFYACNDRQFLPAGKNKITEALNPIQFSLCSFTIKTDGTFKLPLRLITDSSPAKTKQNDNKRLYELDEEIASKLHPTPHDPQHFRLACTLVKDNTIAWDTLCLSDYIRPRHHLQT